MRLFLPLVVRGALKIAYDLAPPSDPKEAG
jgi:hypothetical protein